MKPRVFISYVRDNETTVVQLARDLEAAGIHVWYDKRALLPGQWWQQQIRMAIRSGNFFIACFSHEYTARPTTYMNEELTLAIEELRLRPTDRTWFIPVLLNEGAIPDREIGGGANLRDVQAADLSGDWDAGLAQIIHVLRGGDESVTSAPRAREPALPLPSSPRTPAVADDPPVPQLVLASPPRLDLLERRLATNTAVLRQAQQRRSASRLATGQAPEAIGVLIAICIALEWFPARIAVAGNYHAPLVEQGVLSAALAFVAAASGVMFGELLYRGRLGKRTIYVNAGALTFALAVAAAVVAIVYLGASEFFDLAVGRHAALQGNPSAAALAAISAIGIAIPALAVTFREPVNMSTLRWTLRRLQREVAIDKVRLSEALRAHDARKQD